MTEIVQEKPTAEEIARHYSAAMDSVNLINGDKPEGMEDADWADTVKRNVEHLEIMVKRFHARPRFSPVKCGYC